MLRPGDVIGGNLRLIERVGRGGFATVFSAQELKGARQTLAVKVFAEEPDEREMDILAKLAHPHILRYRATLSHRVPGTDEDILCLITDFADGGDCGSLLKTFANGLPEDQVRHIVLAIAKALVYLHGDNELGEMIVHRDIKPSNILIVAGKPCLGDVGIAKSLLNTSSTHTGIQTLEYTAPEMFHGKVHLKSDTYALGVTCFELLTGRLPFGGTPAEVMMGHLGGEIPFHAEVSQEWRQLIRNMMNKDLEARWTAKAIVDALEPPQSQREITPLQKITSPDLIVGRHQIGHYEFVSGITLIPSKRLLASCGYDASIHIWNIDTWECERVLKGHQGRLHCLTSLGDGLLASAGDDAVIRLLNAVDGNCLQALHGHEARVVSLAASQDGAYLVSGDGNGIINLWSVKSGRHLLSIEADEEQVHSLAFNGKDLFAVGSSNVLRRWMISLPASTNRAPNAKWMEDILVPSAAVSEYMTYLRNGEEAEPEYIRDIFLSPGEDVLIAVLSNQTLLWNIGGDANLYKQIPYGGSIANISIDGSCLVCSDFISTKVVDLDSGECYSQVGAPSLAASIAVNIEEFEIYVGGYRGSISVNRLELGCDGVAACNGDSQLNLVLGEDGLRDFPMALNQEGSLLAYAIGKSVYCVDLLTGEQVWEETLIDEDDEYADIVTVCFDGNAGLWISTSGYPTHFFVLLPDGACVPYFEDIPSISAAAFSCGERLAYAGWPSKVVLRDSNKPINYFTWADLQEFGSPLGFSGNGGFLAVVDESRAVLLLDTSTGEVMAKLGGHSREVNSLAFHPTEELLVSADEISVRIWCIKTHTLIASLPSPGTDTRVAFNLSGDKLAIVGGMETFISVYCSSTFKERVRIEGTPGSCRNLAFQNDSLLIGAFVDGSVRRYFVNP